MENLKRYEIEDYIITYNNSLADVFSNLGYCIKDLEDLGFELIAYLNNTPPKLKGDIIKESGGAIKVRVSKRNSTRGNEDRLIYTILAGKYIILMDVYSKSRKKDLSKKEIKEINKLINQYKMKLTSGLVSVGLVALSPEESLKLHFDFTDEIITLD